MKERSLFLPLALIAAGSLWILVSMGRVPSENLWALAHFWPIVLIAAGLGLILRSHWPASRVLIDVLVVGGAVLAVLFAPQLGWTTPQWGLGLATSFDGALPGSGKIALERREVEGIRAISVQYPAEVIIRQGASEGVNLEAEDNLLAQLGTKVEDGTLSIRNTEPSWARRVNPTKRVRIIITVKDLQEIKSSSAGTMRVEGLETDALTVSLSGAGTLVIDQLSANSLDCRLSGAGSFTASGKAKSLVLRISGVGSFDGEALSAEKADVRLSGVGSATVRATDELSATVSGVGSVNYYGNPKVDKHVSGLGSINRVEQ